MPSRTFPLPWVAPKPDPVTVTCVPAGPLVGFTLVIAGGVTVKFTASDPMPWMTCVLPEAEFGATVAITCVSLQLTTWPLSVPKRTLPLPCVVPNPEPAIVTGVPAPPLCGVTLVIVGVVTVKGTELEVTPPCVTWTEPDTECGATIAVICASLQFVTKPPMEPRSREPLPWPAPKPVPVTVTFVPAGPEVGDTLAMFGPERTEKAAGLLATPDSVTTTLPVVAPVGTGTTMLVELQLVGVAAVPLKVTTLEP